MRLISSVLAATLLVAGVLPALADDYDPRGRWQTTTGESRYDFDYCGDGTKLCGTLVWLDAGGMKSAARKQLGHYAVTEARRIGTNTWRGPLNFDGKTADTKLTFTSAKTMTIAGCYYIFCKSFDLVKIGPVGK